MNAKELNSALEAMLFASGEPLEIIRIAQVLECDAEQVESIAANLSNSLEERNSGLCLKKLGDKLQLCSKQEYAGLIREILDLKRNTPLSAAAFEVLAVIAYNQPVTKSFVEQVRGVDCSGVIATLCQRGLIEEKGRLELPGRPLIYGTTAHFLRSFCVSDLSELPPLPEKKGEELQKVLEEPKDTSDKKNAMETVVLSAEDDSLISESDDAVFNEDFT